MWDHRTCWWNIPLWWQRVAQCHFPKLHTAVTHRDTTRVRSSTVDSIAPSLRLGHWGSSWHSRQNSPTSEPCFFCDLERSSSPKVLRPGTRSRLPSQNLRSIRHEEPRSCFRSWHVRLLQLMKMNLNVNFLSCHHKTIHKDQFSDSAVCRLNGVVQFNLNFVFWHLVHQKQHWRERGFSDCASCISLRHSSEDSLFRHKPLRDSTREERWVLVTWSFLAVVKTRWQ